MGLLRLSTGKMLLGGTKPIIVSQSGGGGGSPPPAPTTLRELFTAMIGQSNMVHLSDEMGNPSNPKYYITNKLAKRWINGALERIGWYDTTDQVIPGTVYAVAASGPSAGSLKCDAWSKDWGKRGDGICRFVNDVTAATNNNLITYEYAVSGSRIERWMSDYAGGDSCWTPFANAVTASGKALNSACFLQGEDNAGAGTTKAAYKTMLGKLHSQLLALGGKTDPMDFFFGIGIVGPGTTYAAEGNMGIIRQAQLEYIAENAGAYLAGVATDMNLAGDAIHFEGSSEEVMGARYAVALKAWAAGNAVKFPGPKITTATRSNLTVTVHTSGGTGNLKDRAGGTGTALKGFRFFDNGVQMFGPSSSDIVASTSLSGTDIIITLKSAPTGTLTMDYAMANAPFGGTLNLSSVVCDSASVPLPLIPSAAITVTLG